MTSTNRPDRITLDAFSDRVFGTQTVQAPLTRTQYQTASALKGYSSFTNTLSTPILGAKSIQLLSGNMINSTLQLNDNTQLVFYYYASNTQAGLINVANLRIIRLHPSTFVPQAGYTTFVRNRFFASVNDLVTALNQAASTGGDSVTYNPLWVPGQVTFSFSQDTRKISIAGNGTTFIAPAAIDDPNVQDYINGRGVFSVANVSALLLPVVTSSGRITAPAQPQSAVVCLNPRLGFTYRYNTIPLYAGPNTQVGCCTQTGVPSNSTTAVEADGYPILLGTQNVSIYTSVSIGGGLDSLNRKNLVGNIPIEVPPLCVNSYTLTSVETPSLSTPNEIYEITIEMRDEYGDAFIQPFNYNTQLTFGIKY